MSRIKSKLELPPSVVAAIVDAVMVDSNSRIKSTEVDHKIKFKFLFMKDIYLNVFIISNSKIKMPILP